MSNFIETAQQRHAKLLHGESSIEGLRRILLVSHYITKRQLSTRDPRINLADELGILLRMGNVFLTVARTLFRVCELAEDEVSAKALLRTLADHLAAMYLIFGSQDSQEQTFRLLLFFLDGSFTRIQDLDLHLVKDETILQEDFDTLQSGIEKSRKDNKWLQKKCLEVLDSHPYKRNNSEAFDIIVKNRNWRYKELNVIDKRKNTLSWKIIYQPIADTEQVRKFFASYLSTYVHGLSHCILATNRKDTFDELSLCAMSIGGRYKQLLDMKLGIESNNACLIDECSENPKFKALMLRDLAEI